MFADAPHHASRGDGGPFRFRLRFHFPIGRPEILIDEDVVERQQGPFVRFLHENGRFGGMAEAHRRSDHRPFVRQRGFKMTAVQAHGVVQREQIYRLTLERGIDEAHGRVPAEPPIAM